MIVRSRYPLTPYRLWRIGRKALRARLGWDYQERQQALENSLRSIEDQLKVLQGGKPDTVSTFTLKHVDEAMARHDWHEAIGEADALLATPLTPEMVRRVCVRTNIARRMLKLDQLLADIASYKAAHQDYLRREGARKIAVYTAIAGNYDSARIPEYLAAELEYILYTDVSTLDFGPYNVRPLPYFHADPCRSSRFVKTHPHHLLTDFDIAIWFDANITIRADIGPLIEAFIASGEAVAGIPHPKRFYIHEEARACIEMRKDAPGAIEDQVLHYAREGFECDDLIETNVMMFNLRDPRLPAFLNTWWREIDRFSRRDQLSINYALHASGIGWHRLMERPLNIRNYPALSLSGHDGGGGFGRYLCQALLERAGDVAPRRPYADVRDRRVAEQRGRSIDIIVCVHNALDDVRKCLESVLSAMDSPKWRLILIDDGSEKETRDYLTGLASRPQVTLHRNEVMVGYTKAANRGIAMSSGELVILLNSDTIVVPGWAEKLADALFSTPGAGIVGPLSNAASHQSIPEHRDANGQSAINDLPHGVTVEEMDRHCERWTEDGPLPRVPLVHGFCFGIARPVIEAIGGFDQESFPFGYAEENDYCFRATDAGFGLVLATHTFVFHAKTKSYSAERRALLAKAGGEAFRRKHGKDRVERATRTMQDNPILMHFRECARAVEKGAFASLNRGSTHQKEPTPTGAARSSMRHGADFRSPMLRAPSGTPRAS